MARSPTRDWPETHQSGFPRFHQCLLGITARHVALITRIVIAKSSCDRFSLCTTSGMLVPLCSKPTLVLIALSSSTSSIIHWARTVSDSASDFLAATSTASSSSQCAFPLSTSVVSSPDLLPCKKRAEQVKLSGQAQALELLASQPSHYVTALLMGRRYLLTPNDVLTVPKLKGVQPGQTIALTRILEVGSRDYTLRAGFPSSASAAAAKGLAELQPASARTTVTESGTPKDWQRHPDALPYLGAEVVSAQVTVIEHTKGRMFEVEKFKRRKGYRRTLRSKLEFTKLRVGPITIGNVE